MSLALIVTLTAHFYLRHADSAPPHLPLGRTPPRRLYLSPARWRSSHRPVATGISKPSSRRRQDASRFSGQHSWPPVPVLMRQMLKHIVGTALNRANLVSECRNPWFSLLCRSCFHDGQLLSAPRSFFGVEDFVDDDNSRPYTYKKEKKSKNPEKHVSFKQRTGAYMEPFSLDVFISKRFVSASLTHRVTSKQVAVAGTNSKDIKAALKSRSDIPACLAVGRYLAERAKEADVYTATYTPRERDKFEGKIRAVVQSLIDSGIDVKVYLD